MTTEIQDIITYDFGNRWSTVMDYDIRKYHEGRIVPIQDRITALEAVRGMDGREVELKKDYYPPLAEGATPEEGQEPAVIWRLKPRSDADTQEWNLLVFIKEIKGDKGDEGIQGERGPAGLPGVDGHGIHLFGTVATATDLHALTDVEIGRCWLALDTKHVWLCKALPASVASSWEDLGTITGIKGEKGATGDTGATGARGPKGDKGDSGGISSFLLNWIVGTVTNQAISTVTMQLNTSINDAINDMAMQLGNLAEDAAESALSKAFDDMYDELKGEKGADGKDGKDGTVCTIVGSVASVADLPLIGNPGEAYLVGNENDLYLWIAPVWRMVGNIKGDKGEKGEPGDAALPALIPDKFLSNNGVELEWVDIGLPNSANKDEANDFTNTNQTINSKQIVTVIDGGANSVPIGVLPNYDGQLFLSYRNTGTPEAQGAMWVGKGNQWLPIASEGGGSIDESNLAKLDTQNIFAMPQLIGESGQRAKFVSGRRTSYDPTSSSSPDFLPYAEGDLLFRHYLDSGVSKEQIYMAGIAGDANSWVLIYDSEESITSVSSELTLLDNRVDSLSDKLDLEITDLDNLSTTVGDIDQSITGIEGDVSLIGTKVDLLEPRILANEQKIAALETQHTENQTTFGDHDTRLTTVEDDCHNLQIGINGNQTEIQLAKGRLDTIETKLPDTLEADKLLVVNSAGDGIEMSTLTSTEALGLKAFAEGSATGDTLLSTKCLGGDTLIYSGNVAASATSGSNFVFGVPGSGTTKTCELGDIQPYNSTDVGSGKVREGCLLTIVNAGAGTLQITTVGSTKVQGRSGSWDTYNLASNKTLLLIPQIWSDGTKCFNIVGIFPNA